ncbi:MAG: helicase, partial [Gammaproteobacteria bacterium]|nr:helicase [Gammaproteobacteria bacterium]
GTALIYTSKSKIYDGRFLNDFSKYIDLCVRIEDEAAIKITDELKSYIGASSDSEDKRSTLIQMMERGVVIHHGSMPLKARLLVERFIRLGYAKICLSTSTLAQGINMPFDVVWIDNFKNMSELTLKNLIGRSGRTRKDRPEFDFGYTVIKAANVKTFIERISKDVELTNVSPLDNDLSEIDADYNDIVDAVKNDTFNDDMHLPEAQIERIRKADVAPDVKYVLDNLMEGNRLKTADEYYELTDHFRGKIKKAIKKLYCNHLRRSTLTSAEQAVVSAAIPIMLWHVQGTSFSQIVSMRHSFISKRDERTAINRAIRNGDITATEGSEQLNALKVRGSPNPFSLPNIKEHRSYIYSATTSVLDIEYDKIVYDTYDYLDKVISQSISDPLCAVFQVYYQEVKQDPRALAIQNYIRFGTNEEVAIWLLKYGIDPEDIEWLKKHIASVDEKNIEFKDSILDEPLERLESVERYI